MFKDCLAIFKKKYQEKGESYILDDYRLSEGSYVLVGQDLKVKQVLDLVKTKGKKEEVIDQTLEGYEMFCYMDYYSYCLNTQKCISSKSIHSNNYLSFMVKKEKVKSRELKPEDIHKYYYLIAHPEKKYKGKKKSLALYEEISSTLEPIDLDKLAVYENWIQEHLFTLIGELQLKSEKGYLKIFFEQVNSQLYTNESKRYVFTNIYNSTNYNVMINNITYGMPNDNLGLNSNKPYLKHMSRKNSVPYLIDTEEVLLQKKFMDYLRNAFGKGCVNIYLNENDIITLDAKSFLSQSYCQYRDFTGYFLRIAYNEKNGITIIDQAPILHYKMVLENFYIRRSLPDVENGSFKCGPLKELKQLAAMIDSCFFKNLLSQSYFGDLPEDAKQSGYLKKWILQSREAFFDWFYKGDIRGITQIFPLMSLQMICKIFCDTQDKYYKLHARQAWILRDSILTYFSKGDKAMGDVLEKVYEELGQKLLGDAPLKFESDQEYFCGVGQLAYYLLTLNKSSKRTHALINPILNAKTDAQLKEQLRRLFVKYNYDIAQGAMRFNRLYAMITAYTPQKAILQDVLLYGYLQENLLYKSLKNTSDAVEE